MSIILDKVNYIYSAGTAYEMQALKNINLKIEDGEFIGIIGHTGSGKSTLIQHLNGLIRATSGQIYYNEENIYSEDYVTIEKINQQFGLELKKTYIRKENFNGMPPEMKMDEYISQITKEYDVFINFMICYCYNFHYII